MRKSLFCLFIVMGIMNSGEACTGISFFAADGGYVQARTIEWGDSELPSEYVIVARGQPLRSYTPAGINGTTCQKD